MSENKTNFDVVVIGLGKTGMSCVRFLAKQGLSVAVTDDRKTPPYLEQIKKHYPTVYLQMGEIKQSLLFRTKKIILSPGVSPQLNVVKKAIKKGITVIGDIELFCQNVNAPIIAITGTNGKSTVTTLVAKITESFGIKTAMGGNLGTPALELLSGESFDLYVLELSSFQLETVFSLNAKASAVLNIATDHMDRHIDIENYAKIKQKVYFGNGLMVINIDDKDVYNMAKNGRNIKTFSVLSSQADFSLKKYDGDNWLCDSGGKVIRQKDLDLKGTHNVANVLAAMALVSQFKVTKKCLIDVLVKFKGLPHRCQQVAVIDGVYWYNDSKATNIEAGIASIRGLCKLGKIILIAGGDSKGVSFSGFVPAIKEYVRKIFLLGVDAKKIADVIASHIPYEFVSDVSEAVKSAHKIAKNGEVVLLAPACSSLDMYESYQHRGNVFISAVERLRKN